MSGVRLTLIKAALLAAAGLETAAAGIYVSEADDAPGAALVGILLLIAAVVIGIRMVLRARSAAARESATGAAPPA